MSPRGKTSKRSVQVALGDTLLPVGHLDFTVDGSRQHTAFTYDKEWRAGPKFFDLFHFGRKI